VFFPILTTPYQLKHLHILSNELSLVTVVTVVTLTHTLVFLQVLSLAFQGKNQSTGDLYEQVFHKDRQLLMKTHP